MDRVAGLTTIGLAESRQAFARLVTGVAAALFVVGTAWSQANVAAPAAPAASSVSAVSAASGATRMAASATNPSTSGLLSPSWDSLSPSQKNCLAPLQSEWDQLDSALKGKWLEIAARYPKLSAEHQQRLRDRMVAWTRMTPAERQKARIGYQYAGELRSEEQASRLQAKWAAYQALSPETRQRLAERAAEKASERNVGSLGNAGKGSPEKVIANRASLAGGAGGAPVPAPVQRGPLTLSSSGPTVVLARPGATTVLLTQRAEAPLPGASAAGGYVRPLRSPRAGHLNPQTLLPRAGSASQAEDTSR